MILQTSARMVADSSVAGAIALVEDEVCILVHAQPRNARSIESDRSDRFRTPRRFETEPPTDFVR